MNGGPMGSTCRADGVVSKGLCLVAPPPPIVVVQEALDRIMVDRTSVVVAHRSVGSSEAPHDCLSLHCLPGRP